MMNKKHEYPYGLLTETLDHAWDYFYEFVADNLDNVTAMNFMASLNTQDVYSKVKTCLLDNVKVVSEDE